VAAHNATSVYANSANVLRCTRSLTAIATRFVVSGAQGKRCGTGEGELWNLGASPVQLLSKKEGTANAMNRSSGTGINTNPAVDARAVKRINKELERIQRFVRSVSGHVAHR